MLPKIESTVLASNIFDNVLPSKVQITVQTDTLHLGRFDCRLKACILEHDLAATNRLASYNYSSRYLTKLAWEFVPNYSCRTDFSATATNSGAIESAAA